MREGYETLLLLAEHPALPAGDVDALIDAADPQVLPVLARRPDLTAEQVAALAAVGDRAVFLALVESGNLPAARVPRDDPQALLAGIERADAPTDWLELLASWPDPLVRKALAEHASQRPDIARIVAGDVDCSVAATVAPLDAVQDDVLPALFARTEACLRVALAARHDAPAHLLADLITGGGSPALRGCPHLPDPAAALREVRLAAAGNRATPTEAVAPFAADPDVAMARALAGRRDLPPGSYERLVEMGDPLVTGRVAGNSAAPDHLLRRLYDTGWRDNVLNNWRTPLDVLVRHSRAGDGWVATDYHPDIDGLRVLAADPDPKVRFVAAASHRLPEDLRAALIDDPDLDVTRRAVSGSDVPAEDVRRAAARWGPPIFTALAAHPSAPPDLLHTIATHPDSPAGAVEGVAWQETASPATLEACLRVPSAAVCLAGNPSTPPAILAGLVSHPDPQVRTELARNPALSSRTVHELLAHPRTVLTDSFGSDAIDDSE
ncbi:hypothetical protein AB0K00_30085 [Dactylosporangium sp. NPDC049525]|uniref:hypothetical protein n=1 Tax=Dactylosporangium sp. NPDC049525 TaxID=3154730 RepID=UPI0034220E08